MYGQSIFNVFEMSGEDSRKHQNRCSRKALKSWRRCRTLALLKARRASGAGWHRAAESYVSLRRKAQRKTININ
jgi:hypothetical protein